jgi:uncharacterized protein
MRSVQSTSLRKTLFKELREVSSGREPVQILRHGKPIAVLVPALVGNLGNRKPLLDLDAISAFSKRHGVRAFYLFGSVLREDFDSDSDVDVMVDMKDKSLGLAKWCSMMDELEVMFGRKIDLVRKDNIEALDPRYHRRSEILGTAKAVYDEAA